MVARARESLEAVPFAEALLRTEDLDPVYVALQALEGRTSLLRRWLLAYSCFYSVGAASFIAEAVGEEYWERLKCAAENLWPPPLSDASRWPRGAERRHFRGAAAVRAVELLRQRYRRPEQFAAYVAGKGGAAAAVQKRVLEHYLFGPWIAYKVADILERVLAVPIQFERDAVFMYAEPKAGAQLYAERYAAAGFPSTTLSWSVVDLQSKLSSWKAPPRYERPVGVQEIETVFCKWKSYWNGHYWVGKDIHETRHSLLLWKRVSKLAGLLLESTPLGIGEAEKRLW